MEALIQPFIDYLRSEKRYSVHTVRAYQDDLVQFFDYAGQQFGVRGLRELSPAIVRSWLAALREDGVGARSVVRKISTLKSFYKYQLRIGAVEQSPMTGISSPKMSKRLPVYVEQEDTRTLFAAVEFPEGWEGRTDRLLLMVFYQTGMRLSELVNLKEGQVDGANGVLRVLGKGNKERLIPVGAELLGEIGAYCDRKGVELEEADREYLFVGKGGRKLYPKYVYRVVRKYLTLITTLEKRSPHVLRHSFATHLANGGADLNAVKELLGHSSLAATQVYTHNTIGKLMEVYKKAHPKA